MENNDGNISRIWKEEEIYLFKKIRKILIKTIQATRNDSEE